MNIVFFTHPSFSDHQSMPRFAKMLTDGMKERGHHVQIWAPRAKFRQLVKTSFFKKWFGYVDQYVLFPRQVKKMLKSVHQDSLFVFTDNALGPWVPLVAERPHVIHCHDFLAQRSAKEEIEENKTSWTGKQYQNLIKSGYSQGNNFISVSQKTQQDLHRFLNRTPKISEVVYNGLNRNFKPGNIPTVRKELSQYFKMDLTKGFILHVGGNQWYKNRIGLLKIYDAWREISSNKLTLLCIGEAPNDIIFSKYLSSKFTSSIHFLKDVPDEMLKKAYVGASAFIFPSLDEGFGWPIAEAMASGTPVMTTNRMPMTEVTNGTGIAIDRMPFEKEEQEIWAIESARKLESLIIMSPEQKQQMIKEQVQNAARFKKDTALDSIEDIYLQVLEKYEY